MRPRVTAANLAFVRSKTFLHHAPRIVIFFRIVFIAVLLCPAVNRAFAAAELTFLRTEGTEIVNADGQKVLLRGVGLGNWLLPEGYMWKFGNQVDRPRRIEKLVSDLIGAEHAARFWSEFRKNYITEADIQRIAELGYNSVRPALNSRLFLTESDPPQPVEEGFQILDNLVKWCKARGIYVIIDMHGAPGGQTGQNIDDSANDQPELFIQPKYEKRLTDLWTDLASRYRDEPSVAGYDLLNEPLPKRTGAADKYKAQLEPLYQRLTQAIRKVDQKHMMIVEGCDWANDWSAFTKPFDKNLVYQFHYYCWDTPAKLKSVGQYLNYRLRFDAPVWVGETGERDKTIYWGTTDYFEANHLGWSFWPWKKMDADNGPYSIKRPQNWDSVIAFSRGEKPPSRELAEKIFDELLVNIRLENCIYHPDVVNAMFRRAPARIEAENYGHEGAGISYFVKSGAKRAANYRVDEPVPIKAEESRRPRSAQYVTLTATEWTAYNIGSKNSQRRDVTLRARAAGAPADAQLQVGARTIDVKLQQKEWSEIKLSAVQFEPGQNRIRWTVKQGTADLDWIDVGEAENSQQSAILQNNSGS
jgi:endoglucanase